MTTEIPVEDRLGRAIALREEGQVHAARALLLEVHSENPDDPRVNLHCAWIHDKLGLEAEAVPFYERAIAIGLRGDDLHDALLGLGSTYRALGRYQEAMETLDQATSEFPEDGGLQVFRAMTLYNRGVMKEAVETLLAILVETTSDPSIVRYRPALAEYSADLDRTWS